MTSDRLKYYRGLKYQVQRDITLLTGIRGYNVSWRWITLAQDGRLHIKAGYSWDGASGPTIDTKSSMRGSLGHDALYQLMRQELIQDRPEIRAAIDDYLYRQCVADGMWRWRARLWLWGVRRFAKPASHPDHKRKIYTAP